MRPSSQGSRSTSRLDFGFDFERTDERAARVQEEGELQFFFFSSTFDSVTIWCRCNEATDCPEKTREIEKSPVLDEWITNVCDKHLYFVREVRRTKLKKFYSECFFFASEIFFMISKKTREKLEVDLSTETGHVTRWPTTQEFRFHFSFPKIPIKPGKKIEKLEIGF